MKTYREAVFSGWFGPMGVGAVFLSMIAKEEMLEIYHDAEERPVAIDLISPVVLFIVLSSTLVHGTTIPLFKIGNRIRTRTLSIASTGSGQIRRLPKLQFGQHVSLRKSEDDRTQIQAVDVEAMSQLKRNTLANTIQHAQSAELAYTIDMHDDEDDEEGLKEEDFLPDESDETQVGDDNRNPLNTTPVEPQSIRFLEPVNPRSGSASQNIEKNETSVSSFKSWMNRNNKAQDNSETADTETAVDALTTPAAASTGSGGLRNLFRRNVTKENLDEQQEKQHPLPTIQVSEPNENEQGNHLHLPFTHGQEKTIAIKLGIDKMNPRIEIWDEPNHIVLEDKQDASSHTVIAKTGPNWEEAVKQRISELQANIENEVPPKAESSFKK